VNEAPDAAIFLVKVPVEVAFEHVKAKELAAETETTCVQEAPLTVKLNEAFPVPDGVPDILKVRFPVVPE
jgi:hypothetical protein